MTYVVDPRKLSDYLLSDVHPVGRHKARVFKALGYDAGQPQRLADDLRKLAEHGEVRSEAKNDFGSTRVVGGTLYGPSGSGCALVTVWIRLNDLFDFRLVTAYPE
jgi:hypothetical protein